MSQKLWVITYDDSFKSIKSKSKMGKIVLTPGAQMAFWTPFFPFGLKCKQLSRRHVMISLRSFLPEIKTTRSSFFKSIYIFDIFHPFYQFEHTKSEVWKGKNLCALGVKPEFGKILP